MKWTLLVVVLILVGGSVAYFANVLPAGISSNKTTIEPVAGIDDATTSMDEVSFGNTPTEDTNEVTLTTTATTISKEGGTTTTLIAGGCFWCVESDIEKLPGVISGISGYGGGTTENPTYQNYHDGGHREVVEVKYDTSKVSYEQILIYAMKHMDPTDGGGSFYDRGESYSPAFYYKNDTEKATIENLIKEVNEKGPYGKPLQIVVLPLPKFWPAEDYHQDYYKGILSKVKYEYYRKNSGRDDFITKYWGADTGPNLPWRNKVATAKVINTNQTTPMNWKIYTKPSQNILKAQMDPAAFSVTQEQGTERSHTSPLDKNFEKGIYVDILSGEPLYSSKEKFDSGTGWPSFVKPISPEAVIEKKDNGFFSSRTEIRSAIADNHIGHVFTDGPKDRGGLRYCMNGVALRFVPESDMDAAGYGDFKSNL